ncbi:MAG: signal peptidase I [Clostridia bacterium]|nr:signal peptidase I [Clostridia bacterium]
MENEDIRVESVSNAADDRAESAEINVTEEAPGSAGASDSVSPGTEAPAAENAGAGDKIVSFLYDTVGIVISAIAVIMVLFTFAFRIVGVSGSSMVDTLHDNDWLIVTPYYSEPKPLDIVIITQPNFFNEPLVKRIIATEGDVVDIDHDKGIVYVNGEALDEPYTNTLTTEYVTDEYEWPVTVPEGCVLCMGDNRNGSTDSRSKLVGMIDKNYLLGCARMRFIPFGDWDIYSTTPSR